jgi:hypothetical protein
MFSRCEGETHFCIRLSPLVQTQSLVFNPSLPLKINKLKILFRGYIMKLNEEYFNEIKDKNIKSQTYNFLTKNEPIAYSITEIMKELHLLNENDTFKIKWALKQLEKEEKIESVEAKPTTMADFFYRIKK